VGAGLVRVLRAARAAGGGCGTSRWRWRADAWRFAQHCGRTAERVVRRTRAWSAGNCRRRRRQTTAVAVAVAVAVATTDRPRPAAPAAPRPAFVNNKTCKPSADHPYRRGIAARSGAAAGLFVLRLRPPRRPAVP